MQRNLNVCNVPLCHLLVFSLDWVLITFVTPCNKISLKIPAQKLSRIGLKNGNFELYCLEGSSQQENNLSLNGPSNQILNWQESTSKVSFSATLVLRAGKNLKWKWMKTCYYLNIPRNQSVLAILTYQRWNEGVFSPIGCPIHSFKNGETLLICQKVNEWNESAVGDPDSVSVYPKERRFVLLYPRWYI